MSLPRECLRKRGKVQHREIGREAEEGGGELRRFMSAVGRNPHAQPQFESHFCLCLSNVVV